MEKTWKLLNLFLGLLYCQLCNGLPINLENTVADSHTQLLTGLIAVLLTVCSVVFLAGCLCCQRRNGFKEFRDSPVVASAASNLDHGHINPVANGEFTIFTPLSPPHQNNNVFLANQQIITRTQDDYIFGDVDVSSWFNGTETDFPRIKLKYIKEIGKGWFGRVVEGAAQDITPDQKWTPVVVRILEATASSRERVVFLHDAAIYRCGAHQNILKLFGRCLDTIPLLLLQEYCPQGDLKNYLRQNKSTAEKLLQTEYPLVWCCQLTSAVKHLHDNKLTHPDLAARNCQLASNLSLKLGDYGLAVFQYPEDYYQGAPGVPVRWCAPESLSYTSTTIEPKKITFEANVWSLAVTMWEICECGEQPYSSLTDDEVVTQVLGSQNVRLPRPKYQVLYTDYIFRLMQLCWTNSESRPTVARIDFMLGDLLQVYKNTTSSTQSGSSVSMKDFDKRWESFKPNSIVKTDNHISDATEIELDDSEMVTSKPLSPSLNNLHGSLDNLLVDSSESQMESWLENVATKTGDMSYVKGLSDAIKDLDNAIALENTTSSDSSHQQSPAPEHVNTTNTKLEFKLGPQSTKLPDSPNQSDSLTDSLLFVQRTSSESETEEENWKKKIERGAYTEKVRQKSRSVADLMILTHIEHSESESETPLPSLDYRANYRNVRYAPKQNLENVSLMFGSEGNLLNVQETFQEELKKLQEERRDSLLFVPETRSQNDSSENLLSDSAGDDDTVNAGVSHNLVPSSVSNNTYLEGASSKRILQELNSTSEIKPANQVFNVFNVTIDKFSPVHLNSSKLNELIHFKEDDCVIKKGDMYQVPKLSDIIRSNSELVDCLNHSGGYDYPVTSLSDGECENSEVMYDSGVEGDRVESTESLKNTTEEKQLIEISLRHEQTKNDEKSKNDTHLRKTTETLKSAVVEEPIEKLKSDFSFTETTENLKNVTEDNTSVETLIKHEDMNHNMNRNETVEPLRSFVEEKPFTNQLNSDIEIMPTSDNSTEEKTSVSNEELNNRPINEYMKNIVEKTDNILIVEELKNGVDSDETMVLKNSIEEKPFTEELKNDVSLFETRETWENETEKKLSDNSIKNEEIEKDVPFTTTTELLEESIKETNANSDEELMSDVHHTTNATETLKNADGELISVGASVKNEELENPSPLIKSEDDIKSETNVLASENSHIMQTTQPSRQFQVPKLVDIIQDNDELMDYIIAKYETESLGKTTDSLDSLEMCAEQESVISKNSDQVEKTKEFLQNEIKNYEDMAEPKVTFDLSETQEEAMPNSLTHSSVFTSTPFTKRSLQELSSTLPHEDAYCSLNLFDTSADKNQKVNNNLTLYSLETWDNFLGKALDNQNESQENELFDSFSSEPQSLLFVDNEIFGDDPKAEDSDSQETQQDKTYVIGDQKSSTFVMNQNTVDIDDIKIEVENESKPEDDNTQGTWENNGGGWFLHPQSNGEISGEITVSSASSDSYVGFNVDDEIMAAIRTELLNKLPQAQGALSGPIHDDEEWDSAERNEVFLRYNVYNTPLSPIPEESYIDNDENMITPKQHSEDEDDESDWSDQDHCEREILHDIESHSAHTVESPQPQEHLHRHTPSQDSCCSNDTLFNLEELTCAVNDSERENASPTIPKIPEGDSHFIEENSVSKQNEEMSHVVNGESVRDCDREGDNLVTTKEQCENEEMGVCNSHKILESGRSQVDDFVVTVNDDADKTETVDKGLIVDFLINERKHDCVKINEPSEESNSESIDHLLPFINKQVAPLPSPEDKPWKQLPASLLSYDKVISQNTLLPTSETKDVVPESNDLPENKQKEVTYVNIPETNNEISSNFEEQDYENINENHNNVEYENVTNIDDFYNEADYINIVNLENTKNSSEFINKNPVVDDEDEISSPDYVNSYSKQNPLIISNEDEHDIFGVLTDIRFSGPGDNQLMTTSFSESNDLNDEQDWDSGSDTRSSSSGEFIWKEGEHEESLKALRAAPQDVLEDIQPMEGIQEETSSESSGSDEEGESPEFVPSAWDKYATPTKSALRSPEKTLEKTEKKKSKGVWFKKQKYHCVYEYPREPDSPVLHSYDLWKPQPDYSSFDDWELDGIDTCEVPTENSDDYEISENFYRPKPNRTVNMYQLSSVADFTSSESGMDDEFFISSSAKPFDMISGLSSQFFPGNWADLNNKPAENVTPDSGVEDITPGSLVENDFVPRVRTVESLKQLASNAVNANKKGEDVRNSDVLGGLRHTRNRLKLDLPPSPSAFTSNKIFNIEPIVDPVMNREKPTFTTFGKSRFLVQHVDTPPDDEVTRAKNVSFEALPYKPLQKQILREDYDVNKSKGKVEIVRGEASLLDSADEDSGIESSTLERKLSNNEV